jgi:hypothetical protein
MMNQAVLFTEIEKPTNQKESGVLFAISGTEPWFWSPILKKEDGSLNLYAVKRELYALYLLLQTLDVEQLRDLTGKQYR